MLRCRSARALNAACKRAQQKPPNRHSSPIQPLELVNTELIPALDRVGKGFEAGTVFLPQLLMSAEAAKAAFEVVKDAMRGETQAVRGKIILATVKGDIHDIGKNIVKVLLEKLWISGYRLG